MSIDGSKQKPKPPRGHILREGDEPPKPRLRPIRRIREGEDPAKPKLSLGYIEREKPDPLVVIGLLMVVIQIVWVVAMLIMKLYGIE